MRYEHIRALVYDQPWAITLPKLEAIQQLLSMRLAGVKLSDEAIAERIGAADARRGTVRNGAIAVLPIYGVLMQRVDMLSEMSGGTSTERIARDFRQLVADPNIGTIVLDIDSPGGGVYGIAELADEIFRARSDKRIVASADSMAASAAYWLATAADELSVTPSGEVGSIGVYMIHEDWSGAYEQAGITPTLIKYGDNKAEGIDIMPLTDEARANFQKRVNEYGDAFVNAVAKYRGTTAANVKATYGQGRVFGAKEAVRLGMADRVESLQDTLARLSGRTSGTGARADAVRIVEGDGSGEKLPEMDESLYAEDAKALPEFPERDAAQRDLALARFLAP